MDCRVIPNKILASGDGEREKTRWEARRNPETDRLVGLGVLLSLAITLSVRTGRPKYDDLSAVKRLGRPRHTRSHHPSWGFAV